MALIEDHLFANFRVFLLKKKKEKRFIEDFISTKIDHVCLAIIISSDRRFAVQLRANNDREGADLKILM